MLIRTRSRSRSKTRSDARRGFWETGRPNRRPVSLPKAPCRPRRLAVLASGAARRLRGRVVRTGGGGEARTFEFGSGACCRSGHREYGGVPSRRRDRLVRAVGRRDRRAQRRGSGRRRSGAPDDRAHPSAHPSDTTASARRDRRFRDDRADAAPLHRVASEGSSARPRDGLRAERDHSRRAERRRAGNARRGRREGVPDRGASRGGDRRRPAGRQSRSAR